MKHTKILLTRSSMAAIQAVKKMIEFVCGMSDLKINEMHLDMDGGDRYRRVYIGGTLVLCDTRLSFHTSFLLCKGDDSNWIISLCTKELIHFNVSSMYDGLNVGVSLIHHDKDCFAVVDTDKKILKHLHQEVKRIIK